jgi:hypothetical protein
MAFFLLKHEIDGEKGMHHDRYQEKQPEVAVEFVEIYIIFVPHQAAREFESRQAAAGEKNEQAKHDVAYREDQYDVPGYLRVKKCVHMVSFKGRSRPTRAPCA